METDETESGNGNLKRNSETESWNGNDEYGNGRHSFWRDGVSGVVIVVYCSCMLIEV